MMVSKRFPVEQIEVASAEFSGALWFNPTSGCPPRLDYSFGLHLAPRDVFDRRPTTIQLSSMELPARDWTGLLGPHPQALPSDDCTVYVAGVHNPVDVQGLELISRRGTRFDAEFALLLDFEFSGHTYRNIRVRIRTDCTFTGLGFHAPAPERSFPAAWDLPAEYTLGTVSELLGRFVDLDAYDALEQDGRWFTAKPRLRGSVDQAKVS
jgi:hypothetical protein